MDLLFALQFDNHPVFDEQVSTKPAIQLHLFVNQGYGFLSYNVEHLLAEFVSDAALVRSFKKSGPEPTMNGNC